MNPIKQATMVVGSACLALAVIAHQIPSAQANSFACRSLLSQAEVNVATIKNSLNSFEANTAMMTASTSAGDAGSAALYASMNKDLAIRLVGLYVEGRGILTAADNEPGNCGMTDAAVKEYIQSSRDNEKAFKGILKLFK